MSTALKILESIFTDHQGHELFVFSEQAGDPSIGLSEAPAQLVCEMCNDEDGNGDLLIVGQDELKDLE